MHQPSDPSCLSLNGCNGPTATNGAPTFGAKPVHHQCKSCDSEPAGDGAATWQRPDAAAAGRPPSANQASSGHCARYVHRNKSTCAFRRSCPDLRGARLAVPPRQRGRVRDLCRRRAVPQEQHRLRCRRRRLLLRRRQALHRSGARAERCRWIGLRAGQLVCVDGRWLR